MKELRDIKLDLLMGNQNPIVDLFNKITDGIKIINTNVYNNDGLEFIYFSPAKSSDNYHKEDEWIFYQDVKNEEFWCNNGRYWSLFTDTLDLEYEEIQSITKYLVEEALKREVGTPFKILSFTVNPVEEALKREVGTPIKSYSTVHNWVEEALKREVVTPVNEVLYVSELVEEALKREVGTPRVEWSCFSLRVEEALKREVN